MTRHALLCLAALSLASNGAWGQTPAPPNSGFPYAPVGNNLGVAAYNKALVVDLDNNGGTQEIVIGTQTGQLLVLNSDGSVRAGWPQTPCPPVPGHQASELISSPAAGQLDADTALEIVIGCGGITADRDRGQVTAYNPNGTLIWSFATLDVLNGDGQPDAVWTTPALGDLNDDGRDDVVFGSFDQRVYALNGTNGTLLPGYWPVWVRETIFSSAALADLDGDGKLEVMIGADVHAEAPPFNTPDGGALWVFRRNGSQFPGFPRYAELGIGSSPAVGDITGDGCPEIVVGTTFPPTYTDPIGRKLYAWGRDGSVPPGWPKSLVGHPTTSPALANLDADAALEVVATVIKALSQSGTGEGYVYGIDGNGATLGSFPLRPVTHGFSADSLQEPIVVRFGSAATDPSIFVGGLVFEVAHVSKTGTQLSDSTPPITSGAVFYETNGQVFGPAAADLDDNGTLVLVGASGRSAPDPDDLGVYAWNLGTANGTQPWPMFRQGPKRQGVAPGTTGCPVPKPAQDFYTLTPCRISDSRQSAFLVYGGPKLVADEHRTITIHDTAYIPGWRSACGVPATAKTVALNVTVESPTTAGSLTLYPSGDGFPGTSTLNFAAGQTRANNAVMPLSFDGRGNLTVYVNMPPGGQVHVILDVFGYFQ